MQEKAEQDRKRRKTGKRSIRALACAAAFCTVYALIQPAFALESSAVCGIEEHKHAQACYTQGNSAGKKVPVCTPESLGVHTHTESCPAADGQYTCGASDYIIHTHDENCYNGDGALWCRLAERGEHAHTDACYTEAPPKSAHEHTESCYSAVRGELICTAPTEAHEHTEACYEERETLSCELPESGGHTHGEACLDENGALICTIEESEGHSHGADCYAASHELICTLSEQAHEHTDACYALEQKLICSLPTETAQSGARVLICGSQRGMAHQHGEGCFRTEAPAEAEKLTCTKAESGEHKHGAQCYGTWVLSCGKDEHTHGESCYQSTEPWVNPGEDPGADLESEAVWEKSVGKAKLSGDWRHDVIAVAETQLGYTESSRNYVTDGYGTRRGYSRYGAWYGDAYGDWCAMFVSFCLHYAQIPTEAFPTEASCRSWIEKLESEDYALYHEAGSFTPRVGDVIFFDWDGDKIANHVGLVEELIYDEQKAMAEIKTIEGNNGPQVASFRYAPDDRRILGYGEMPEKPAEPKQKTGIANARSLENDPASTAKPRGTEAHHGEAETHHGTRSAHAPHSVNSQRLLAHGHMVDSHEGALSVLVTADARQIKPQIVAPLLAGPLLLMLLIGSFIRTKKRQQAAEKKQRTIVS